ncbi:hypothetical protein [Natronomonas sp. EA1]|uniref:hypothetical protein n=1 Tax=Natronomonas sp. EA1 TaxID=3421655 RepID=UPI003EB9C559
MAFESLSAGYYVGTLDVVPYSGAWTVARPEALAPVGDAGVAWCQQRYLRVRGDPSLPDRTLAVPQGLFDRLDMREGTCVVFLAKPAVARLYGAMLDAVVSN